MAVLGVSFTTRLFPQRHVSNVKVSQYPIGKAEENIKTRQTVSVHHLYEFRMAKLPRPLATSQESGKYEAQEVGQHGSSA